MSALDDFILNLPDDFLMRTPAWLEDQLEGREPPLVIDVRESDIYRKGHVKGSINIPVRQLPARYGELAGSGKRKIICYCNGSVISAYAITFLASRGIRGVFNLSGGFSRWQKEERATAGEGR